MEKNQRAVMHCGSGKLRFR